MDKIKILGTRNSLSPGEARHYTLLLAFRKAPTGDPEQAARRLKYSLQNTDGEVLFQRNLSLLPDVSAWDIIVEIPKDYHGSNLKLIVEELGEHEVGKTSQIIPIKN